MAKSKTILGRIANLVLDFILYFVTTYITRESNMLHEYRVKHQIHYARLGKVSKKNYEKQLTTVTKHKNVQNYYN